MAARFFLFTQSATWRLLSSYLALNWTLSDRINLSLWDIWGFSSSIISKEPSLFFQLASDSDRETCRNWTQNVTMAVVAAATKGDREWNARLVRSILCRPRGTNERYYFI